MGCSKFILFSIGLYSLALLIAFNEARPADVPNVHHHVGAPVVHHRVGDRRQHHYDGSDGNEGGDANVNGNVKGNAKLKIPGTVVKNVLNGVPDEKVGSIANDVPDSVVGNLLNAPYADASLAAILVKDVPKQEIINALNALPSNEKKDLLKNVKDLPSSIANLPLSQIPAAIVKLPDAKIAQLAVALPKNVKVQLARKFSKRTIGKLVKELPPKVYEEALNDIPADQLQKIISELFNRKSSGSVDLGKLKTALEDHIIDIIAKLPHVYIGEIADELPADVVGYAVKKVSSDELSSLVSELTSVELKAGLKNAPISDIRKELKNLPAATKKAYFGDKADTISSLPSSEVIDILAKLSGSKQAHLIKIAPDVDAGDNVQGLPQEKVGRLVHKLPAGEIRDVVDAIFLDAIAGRDNSKINEITSEQIDYIANKITNDELGQLATVFPASVEGKEIKTLSTRRLTKFLQELHRGDKAAALKNVAPGHIKKTLLGLSKDYLRATFGKKAKNIPNYSDSQIIDLIVNLPNNKQADIIKKNTDVDVGQELQGLPTKKIGRFVHELTPEELRNIIYQGVADILGESNPSVTPEVLTEIIQNLPDERLGNIANAIPSYLVGKLAKTVPEGQVTQLLYNLSNENKLAVLKNIPIDDIRNEIDRLPEDKKKAYFGDKDPSKLSSGELRNLIVDLPASVQAYLYLHNTDVDAGLGIKGLPEPTIGKLLKEEPSDKLTELIYKNVNTLHKELTPALVAGVIRNLNDVQVGDIADGVPANLLGNAFKRLSNSEIAKLLEEIPIAEREEADKKFPGDTLRQFILGLPKSLLKEDFGDKASILSKLPDSQLNRAVEEVSYDKLAHLYLILDDAGAGYNILGFKPEEVGKFIHELPEDDLEELIQGILRDIFGDLPSDITPEQITDIINNLPNVLLGNIADAIPAYLIGKLLKTVPEDQFALLIEGLPKEEKLAALRNIPIGDIRSEVEGLPEDTRQKYFGSKADSLSKLSDNTFLDILADLPTSAQAYLVLHKTDVDAGLAIQGLPQADIGELLKHIPKDQLTKLIYKNLALLQKELTPGLIAGVISKLSDEQIGDFVDDVPATLVGNVVKKVHSSEITKLFKELPLDEREAADKLYIDDLRNFILGLSKDTLKEDFGDKADILSKLSDNAFISAVENVSLDKLADLFLLQSDVDAGYNVQGWNPKEFGKFVHEIPEDEKESIIKSVLNDIFHQGH